MASKNFAIRADKIKPLATGRGGCIATDMILVDGRKVGYMYRDEPADKQDSGWVFTSGFESQEYMDEAGNHGVYDVNTLANYDPEIIPYLDAPAGTSFERSRGGKFVQVAGEPFAPGSSPSAGGQGWPPPGFPVVHGRQPLSNTWALQLPEQFSRRLEDGSLVFWRPGLTIWLTVWDNDRCESTSQRLAGFKQAISKQRWDERETNSGGVLRFSYRLRDENEDGPVESLSALLFNDDGHLQLSIYFDDIADEAVARQIVDSVEAKL